MTTLTRSQAADILGRLGLRHIDDLLDLVAPPAPEAGETMGDSLHSHFQGIANDAAREFLATVAQINGNADLSQEGRNRLHAQAKEKYDRAISANYAKWENWRVDAAQANAKDVAADQAAAEQHALDVLGPTVVFELARQQAANMDDGELGPWALDTTEGGFHREARVQLARLELDRRMRAAEANGAGWSGGMYQSLGALNEAQPPSKAAQRAADLAEAARHSAELDPIAYAENTAPRVGVGAAAYLAQMLG